MIFAGDLIRERGRVSPEKTALIFADTGEQLTYAQLDARVDAAAAGLRAAGIRAGERFGLLASNSLDYVAVFFAAGRCDAIIVPLSTRATPHELSAIAADCSMKLLVFSPDFEQIATQLDVERRPLATVMSAVAAPPVKRQEIDPEAIYCLLYTSGTTGKPKGVMIPRRQLYWNGYNTAVDWDLRGDDVSPVFTPLYHAGGLAAFLIPIFCAGGTIVVHRGFNTSEVWRVIEQYRCTVVLGVPTIWKMLMDAPEFASTELGHVRYLASGGAPLPHFIIEAYQKRGVPLKQGYGMTEVGVNCFTMSIADSSRKAGSIGRPMLFTEVVVVDEEGKRLGAGEVGEMWIRGPHVSKGYWNNEEATRTAFDADGWLHTGDLARYDEDGFFYIAGRRKDMFISGGVNVYPAEIEAELVAHPRVTDAAVVAVPDEKWGEVGVAFVVGGSLTAEELTSYLALRISKLKLPREFVFVEALPRTPYGKVVKEELRRRLVSG